jgi:hypothetical protein
MPRLRTLLLVCLAACCLSSGCVRRRLTVRSNPPGAQVFVDDQEIGTTPCSSSFVYYGTRKVTLIKDGYRTETLYQKLSAPWYQIPPLDFASENLTIREIRDERVVDVQMVPQEIVPQAKLLERANSLRFGAETGQITLPPGAESKPQIHVPGDGLPDRVPIPRYPLPAPAGSVELPPLQPGTSPPAGEPEAIGPISPGTPPLGPPPVQPGVVQPAYPSGSIYGP